MSASDILEVGAAICVCLCGSGVARECFGREGREERVVIVLDDRGGGKVRSSVGRDRVSVALGVK